MLTAKYLERAMHHGTLRYNLLPAPVEIGWMASWKMGRSPAEEEDMIDIGTHLMEPACLVGVGSDGSKRIYYYPVQVEKDDQSGDDLQPRRKVRRRASRARRVRAPEQWADPNVSWFIHQKLKVVEANRDRAIQLVDDNDRSTAFGFFHTAAVTALSMLEITLKTYGLAYTDNLPARGHRWLCVLQSIPPRSRADAEWKYQNARPANIARRYRSLKTALRHLGPSYAHWRYWIDRANDEGLEPLDIDFIVYLTFVVMDMFRWDGQVDAPRPIDDFWVDERPRHRNG